MATINPITDLKINGGDSYTGPGPVTLTWTPPEYSGTFLGGPYISLSVDDGDNWGPDGNPGPTDVSASSYVFPDSIIEHVKNTANQTATIHVSVWGYVENYDLITSTSNDVIYIYSDQEKSNYRTIKSYINGQWVNCVIQYYDGQKWISCTPKHYNGTSWQDCSF